MSYIDFQRDLSVDYQIYTSPTITIGTGTTGTFTLMTYNKPNRNFFPSRIAFVLAAKGATSFTVSPIAAIGTNATTYNNLVASSATTLNFDNTTSTINGVGQWNSAMVPVWQGAAAGFTPITNGTSIILNVTSAGSGGSDHIIVFTIEGFSIEQI